jgi:hypothetical protein
MATTLPGTQEGSEFLESDYLRRAPPRGPQAIIGLELPEEFDDFLSAPLRGPHGQICPDYHK